MKEPEGQLEDMEPHRAKAEFSSISDNTNAAPSHLHLIGSSSDEQFLHTPFQVRESGNNAPAWLRPFFSLHVQLTLVYSVILILVVAVVCLLVYQPVAPQFLFIEIAATVLVGSTVAFTFTSVLLRPLWRVTDAAQAIAIGDLEQRERLPLRLPPQDEIDRLAGSLHEMVTRLERAEEMQYSAEKRFQRFFSDASHQLRTPLTSIRGFTEVLIRGIKDDPETAQRVLKRMKGEVERMTRLINDLLTLARLDDQRPLKLQYVDLRELAADCVEQARSQAHDEREISLMDSGTGSLGLQADRDRLKQLLFIMLDNAIKHGRPAPEGIIRLQLERQNEQIIIQVLDNGEGIDQDDLDHIFDSFYKGHRRRSNLTNGTAPIGVGLGLTIASAIVRAHHGTITVCSDAQNGTEFRVTLPRAS